MTEHDEPSHPSDGPSNISIAKIAIGVATLVAIMLLGRTVGGYVPQFAEWVAELGYLGPIVFIIAYALAAVAFVPGSILTLAAGAIFGLVKGVALVFVAATLGATAAFLISRYVARNAIEQRLAGNEKFAAIDKAVGNEGRKLVFLLRLSPVFPFNLLNYALGLTKVKFADYFVASLGMLPGTILYVYYGKLIGDVAQIASGSGPPRDGAYYAVLVIGLIATIAVTSVVTRSARKALADVTEASETGTSETGKGNAS